MKMQELKDRFSHASEKVLQAEQELTEIDAKYGDADHGLTMAKSAGAIQEALKEPENNIKDMMTDVADAVMVLNGGSAVPLWYTWLDGMSEGAAGGSEADLDDLKKMFASGFSAFKKSCIF